MAWYLVNGTVTISAYTYVQAESPEEAIRLVDDREVELCPLGPARHGDEVQTRSGAKRSRRNGPLERRATWTEAVERLTDLLLIEGWTIAPPER